MQKNNDFFSDFARMASSAGGTFMEMRKEMEQMVAAQVEKFSRKMGSVTREEFEAVREMAQQARLENEALKARLGKLEQAATKPSGTAAGAKPAAAAPKSSAKAGPTTGPTAGSRPKKD